MARKKRVVEAEAFVLKDLDGKTRAELGTRQKQPHLLLFDSEGRRRIELRIGPNGPHANFYNAKGKIQATIAAPTTGAELCLHNSDGDLRLFSKIVMNHPVLEFFGAAGQETRLSADLNSPRFAVYAADHTLRAAVALDSGGNPFEATKAAGVLALWDAKGKLTYKAP